MDFLELAGKRYSCKKYAEERVSREALTAILEAGRLAPTAKNLQEQKIYVLESAEALAKVDSLTPCRYGAPTVLMVAWDKGNVYTYPGANPNRRDTGAEDAAIVATHMILAAASLDVDSCWLNNFDPEEAHKIFALPENEEVLMLMDLGHAAQGAGPLPNHMSRKSLEETVKYL